MIVGISGRKRSGKDTLGRFLIQAGFTRASFADALRQVAYRLNPIVGERRLAEVVDQIGWERAKDEHPEIRRTLQKLGTDAARTVLGEDVWVNAAMNRLPLGDVVFTDVRFPNEADAIRGRGGVIVRLERPGLTDTDLHPSETSMDGYDFDLIVHNDGPLERLASAAEMIVRGV